MLKSIVIALLALVAGTNAIGSSLNIDQIAQTFERVWKTFSNPVKPVEFDANLARGKWHQMYKSSTSFDVFRTDMFCEVAFFEPNILMRSGGFTMLEGYRVRTKDGALETYKRDVTPTDFGRFWMYTEEYFYPRELVVLKVGSEFIGNGTKTTRDVNDSSNNNSTTTTNDTTEEIYKYLVISDSNRLALMVFARDPEEFRAKYQYEVMNFLRENGFGGKGSFWNRPKPIYQQPDCQYPTKQEVFAVRVIKNQQRNGQAAVPQQSFLQNALSQTGQVAEATQRVGGVGGYPNNNANYNNANNANYNNYNINNNNQNSLSSTASLLQQLLAGSTNQQAAGGYQQRQQGGLAGNPLTQALQGIVGTFTNQG